MFQTDDDDADGGGRPRSRALVDTPPEMIQEIAVGLEAPHEVAYRYGYERADFDELSRTRWFMKAVGEAAERLEKSGWSVQAKAAMLAESMLVNAYHAARASDSVTNKLDVAKYLSKIGGLEPNPNQLNHTADGGFSITINIPKYKDDDESDSQKVSIDANAEDVTDMGSNVGALGPRPNYIKIPTYNEGIAAGLEEWDDLSIW
jgi:hypothetical protein